MKPRHTSGLACPAELLDRLRTSAVVGRLLRCASVSVFTTVLSNTVLVLLAGPFGLSPALAAVAANAVGTGPSYALNRRWVWRHDESDLWRQVVPFWFLSFAALGLSALTVSTTAAWADAAGLTGAGRSAAIVAANVSAFAVLWVVQYLFLDKVLFRLRPDPRVPSAPVEDDAGEARPDSDDRELVAA